MNATLTVSAFLAYTPENAVIITAISVFGVLSIVLTIQVVVWRAIIMIPMILFTLCELGGYIAYLVFVNYPTRDAYVGQQVLLVLCPNLIGLTVYSVGSRILAHAGYETSDRGFDRFLDRAARFITIAWFSVDVICILMQGAGGALLATADDAETYMTGQAIILAGIGVQLGVQVLFIVFIIYVAARMPDRDFRRELKWSWVNMCLVLSFLLIRNIYRIVEFAESPLMPVINTTEYPYDFLDLLMMASVGVTSVILDFGRVLPEKVRRVSAWAVWRNRLAGNAIEMKK
jgi:hypothetical protein